MTIFRKTLEFQGLKLQKKFNLQLLIGEITGNPKFKTISPSYLRGSCGALVVADVSRLGTIERIPEYIQLFLSSNPKGFIIVALNKSDLIDEEELTTFVQRVQLRDWEQISGIYLTSAKTGSGVDEFFKQLAYKSLESI